MSWDYRYIFQKACKRIHLVVWEVEMQLFNLFKFFVFISCLKQIDKVLFVALGKTNDTYFIAFLTNKFLFHFCGIFWNPIKSIILGSKTLNQNIHEQNLLPNTKMFKECNIFRTGSICTTFLLQTMNKNGGKGGIEIWLYKNFFKSIKKRIS